MAMKRLKSSNLAGYDYDAATKTLTITFTSGATYEYKPVEKYVADDLENASSPGQYFHRYIRNRYPYMEV